MIYWCGPRVLQVEVEYALLLDVLTMSLLMDMPLLLAEESGGVDEDEEDYEGDKDCWAR